MKFIQDTPPPPTFARDIRLPLALLLRLPRGKLRSTDILPLSNAAVYREDTRVRSNSGSGCVATESSHGEESLSSIV